MIFQIEIDFFFWLNNYKKYQIYFNLEYYL